MNKAQTIVYIHGINQTLPSDKLKKQWDHALFGFDLSERSRMAYWADRGANKHIKQLSDSGQPLDTAKFIEQLTRNPGEIDFLNKIAFKLESAAPHTNKMIRIKDVEAKMLPLPRWMRERIVQHITNAFLKDVHEFFFMEERRKFMEMRFRERIESGNGPFLVIAHSQGSMIAYDVLSKWTDNPPEIVKFITIGSPLGLTEVQDQLKIILNTNKLRIPSCIGSWLNVADPLDPVAFDKAFLTEYEGYNRIPSNDILLWNTESPREPHSATGYLGISTVREAVQGSIVSELFQPVADFRIARDLIRSIEVAESTARHDVLIEVDETNLASAKESILSFLKNDLATRGAGTYKDMDVAILRRYVSAKLTRSEIEILAAEKGLLFSKKAEVQRIWQNGKKRALLDVSAHTVQAIPAHISYNALGKDIHWAVLDSGITMDHPHFLTHQNVLSIHDCCGSKNICVVKKSNDGHGHGTHVAGIIAGEKQVQTVPDSTDLIRMTGVAPQCGLHIYKVLEDDGSGMDSYIIRALDHIWETNENAGRPIIHGVNLSLGGPFDPDVYGCGFSPICRELYRLWRQGVLVVIAAGNEGFANLSCDSGYLQANMDLSISDPANLEEAIVVGSVNKQSPHTYGISYFSSRGPTADGRQKPDVVAPGEKIRSCLHQFPANSDQLKELYVQMSGTSMAAPHVSGILAAFLSVRREFIGQPDVVKQIMLTNCTDLKRDKNHQGAGLPNLIKMLMNT